MRSRGPTLVYFLYEIRNHLKFGLDLVISDLISLISVYQIRQFIHVINGIQRNTKNYKNINRSFNL